jgi:uncharacterized protein
VADAGPLIALARTDHLDLLSSMFREVLIPEAIREELKLSSDRPGARKLRQVVSPGGWVKVRKTRSEKVMSPALGTGEQEAILLAARAKAILLIDDHKGRVAAKAAGVRVIGTGRLLIEAKRRGLLEKISPVLAELGNTGYRLSDLLVKRLKALADE